MSSVLTDVTHLVISKQSTLTGNEVIVNVSEVGSGEWLAGVIFEGLVVVVGVVVVVEGDDETRIVDDDVK